MPPRPRRSSWARGEHPLTASARPRRGLDIILAAILGAGAAAYFGLNVAREINLAEEGTILYIGERILRGMVLYRDMNHHVSPGVFYLTAALMKAFGVSVLPTRYFMLALFGATASLVYLLSRAQAERPFALLAAVSFVFLERRYYSVIYYSPIAVCLSMLGLLSIILYQRRGQRAHAAIAGAAAGLVLCFKQDFAAYTVAASVLSLCLSTFLAGRDPTLQPRGKQGLTIALLLYGVGFAAAVAPLLCYFAVKGALGDMFRYCVLFVLHGFSQDYKLPWPDPFAPMPALLDRGQRAEWVHLRVGLYGTLALFLLAAAGTLRGIARRGSGARLATYASVLFFACLTFLGAFPRTDGYHVVIVMPLALVLVAHTLSGLARAVAGTARPEAREIAVLGVALAAAVPVLVGARYSWRFDLAERAERSALFDSPRARLYLAPVKHAALRRVIDYLKAHAAGNESVFVLPYEPGIYYLTGIDNPTRYDMVLPGNVNAESEKEIIATLEEKRVRYVVLIEQYYFDYLHFRKLWDYAPDLYRYIYTHYRVPADYGIEPTANVGIVGERIPAGERAGFETLLDLVDAFRQEGWGTRLADGTRIQGIRYAGTKTDEIKVWWTVGLKDWMLRRVVFIHPEPESGKRRYAEYRLRVPEGACLRTGLSLFEEVWDRDGRGVMFDVTLVEGGREHGVLSKFVNPFKVKEHRGWLDYEVDLSRYAGRDAVLSLCTASTDDTNAYAWAGYGSPRLVRYADEGASPVADDRGKPVTRVLDDLLARMGEGKEEYVDGGLPIAPPEGVPRVSRRAFGDQACILLHTPPRASMTHVLSYDVEVPPDAELRATYGMASDVWDARKGEGARFRIALRDVRGAVHALAEGEANPRREKRDRRLFPVAVDLAPFTGERVTISFATAPRADTNEYGWAVFGEPRIVRRSR